MTGFNVVFDDPPGPQRDNIDEWCRGMWAALRDGGSWGIKRSGLIFRKLNGKLVLTASMPHMDGMPITAEQLKTQQDSDYRLTVEHFGRVGVEVIDERT